MKHILIVDDDVRICKLLSRLLRRSHYEISAVYHARDAQMAAHYFIYDAIITDVMMPDISGYDFVRKIRNGETYFHKLIPVIMVSAGWEATQRITGLREGADDYMIKPFEPDELVIRLENLLRRTAYISKDMVPVSDAMAQNEYIISGDYRLNVKKMLFYYNDIYTELTQTEAECLALLMSHNGVCVSRYDLAIRFFPETSDNPTSRVVDVMIARLRKKIETLICGTSPIGTRRNEGYFWQL